MHDLGQTPVERLREYSGVPGIHYSRSVVGIRMTRGDAYVGAASGLLIGDPRRDPEFCVVSVRHAIARAVDCEIGFEVGYPASGNRLQTRLTAVPHEAWLLSDDDDLACTAFPIDHLERDHLLRCVHIDQLSYIALDAAPEVTLVGRWGEGLEDGYILSRSGRLATMERPEVRIDIGDDLEPVVKPVYIADATVSRGMSGGAALVHTTPFSVVGLICAHGILPAPLSIRQLPEGTAQQVALALWSGVGAVNAGLAYLIPMDRVRDFLLNTIWAT